jgi:hypothetical protein
MAARSRNAGSNANSPRIARSVIAEIRFQVKFIGQFVDAFLPDHGAESMSAISSRLRLPSCFRLHKKVDRHAV